MVKIFSVGRACERPPPATRKAQAAQVFRVVGGGQRPKHDSDGRDQKITQNDTPRRFP